MMKQNKQLQIISAFIFGVLVTIIVLGAIQLNMDPAIFGNLNNRTNPTSYPSSFPKLDEEPETIDADTSIIITPEGDEVQVLNINPETVRNFLK